MRSSGTVFLWLISLSIAPLRSTRVVKTDKLHSSYGLIVFHYVYMPHFLSPSISGHLSCFCVLASVNNGVMNLGGCMLLCEFVFLFFSNKYPEVELQNHMVVLILIFWGLAILVFMVAVPVYIPTKSAQGFPFLHILSSMCYFWVVWL